MKHAVKPTYSQRKLIQEAGLDSHDWMVSKDTSTEMVLIHRHNERTTKTIQKDWFKSNQFFGLVAGFCVAGFLIGILMGDPRIPQNTKAYQDSPEPTKFAAEVLARGTPQEIGMLQNLTPETVPETAPQAIPETMAETEPAAEPQYTNMGMFKLTAYCSCEHCCDEWAINRPKDENGNPIVYTASSAIAKQGVTVAADTNVLPFGTSLLIDGHEYIVQDRGGAIQGNRIDVYFDSHQEALQFGVQYKEVLVKGDL